MSLPLVISYFNNNAESLNEFLDNMPYFCAGFDASDRSTDKMIEFIKEQIDPELDLIRVGMQDVDGKVDWYNIARKYYPLEQFFLRYTSEKVMHFKFIRLMHGNKRVYLEDLKKNPNELEIKDGNVLSFSFRPSALDRAPLGRINVAAKPRIQHSKRKKIGIAKHSRRKTTLYMPPVNGEKKTRDRWMEDIA